MFCHSTTWLFLLLWNLQVCLLPVIQTLFSRVICQMCALSRESRNLSTNLHRFLVCELSSLWKSELVFRHAEKLTVVVLLVCISRLQLRFFGILCDFSGAGSCFSCTLSDNEQSGLARLGVGKWSRWTGWWAKSINSYCSIPLASSGFEVGDRLMWIDHDARISLTKLLHRDFEVNNKVTPLQDNKQMKVTILNFKMCSGVPVVWEHLL